MSEIDNIIEKVKKANKLSDVLNIEDFKSEFATLMKKVHPDICKHPEAGDITAKLNKLKEEFVDGISYRDDAGEFKTNGIFLTFSGDEKTLKESVGNYKILKSFKDDHFNKYMPSAMELKDGKIEITFDKRAIPLTNLDLPQEHANWILSRLLEYSAWLSQIGYVHCGLNPESVFIVPETHGIQVCSFYHLTKIDSRIKTISGKYQTWYPPNMFLTKKASSTIDLELCKKIAIYLLGDKSGTGIKLRKTHNEAFMDFVISQHYDAHDTYKAFRQLLKDNFEKKFYPLDI